MEDLEGQEAIPTTESKIPPAQLIVNLSVSELESIRDRAQSNMKTAYSYAHDEFATDEDRLAFRQAEAAFNVAYMNWESAKIFERLKEKKNEG